MEMKSTELLIVSQDQALLDVLGGKLSQWGATVHKHHIGEFESREDRNVNVILVDVRQQAERIIDSLRGIRKAIPWAEMVLINRSGNIHGSITGMRAGASDELTVPFEMNNLKQKVTEACERSRMRSAVKHTRSLLNVFERTMSAAAFAEAGEFETAEQVMTFNSSDNSEEKKEREGTSNPEAQSKSER